MQADLNNGPGESYDEEDEITHKPNVKTLVQTENVLLQTKQAKPFFPEAEEEGGLETPLQGQITETCSNAATLNSTASRLKSSLTEGEDEEYYDASSGTPESSYYIVKVGSRAKAFYLHKPQEAKRKGSLEVDVQNVDFSATAKGGPAFLVRLAQRHLEDLSAELLKTKRASEDASTGDPNHEIGAKARQQIEPRRLEHQQLHVINESGRHAHDYKSKYLIDDKDLQMLIDTIRDETTEHAAHQIKRVVRAGATYARPSLPTLDGATISPPPASAVEPAITINQPATSYATVDPEDMKVHTRTRDSKGRATATFVTRKSVAEVTWENDEERPVSSCRVMSRGASSPLGLPNESISRRSSQGPAMFTLSLDHYTALASLVDLVKDLSPSSSFVSLKDRDSMVSFPELLTRQSTQWLSPPVDDEQLLAPQAVDNMYQQGVDAHSGLKRPSIAEPEEPQKPLHCDRDMFGENPFVNEQPEQPSRQQQEMGRGASVASVVPQRKDHHGQSIGVASHRRRSSQPHTDVERRDHNGHIPTFMERIREGGHKIFHRNRPHHRSSDRNGPEVSTPYNSVMDENSPSAGEVHPSDSMVIQMDPASPESDSNRGIYEGTQGKKLSVGHRKRQNTCSEDNQPHECMVDG